MKNIFAFLTLVAIVGIQVHASQVDLLSAELVSLTNATSHLSQTIKTFIGGEKVTDKAVVDRFRELGDLLGKAEVELTDQMSNLGEFLGIVPKVTPPQPPPF